MTLPKKGTRSAQVDGKTYRWRLKPGPRFEGFSPKNMTLVIESPDGAVVAVKLQSARWDPKLHEHSEPWELRPEDRHKAAIKPKDVEAFIRRQFLPSAPPSRVFHFNDIGDYFVMEERL